LRYFEGGRMLLVVRGLGVIVIRETGVSNFSPADVGFTKDVLLETPNGPGR